VDIKSKRLESLGHVIKVDQTTIAVTSLEISQMAQGK
jgi:hypothetical protein